MVKLTSNCLTTSPTLFLSVPCAAATLASILFFAQVKHALTSGPLHLQLLLCSMLLLTFTPSVYGFLIKRHPSERPSLVSSSRLSLRFTLLYFASEISDE